MSPEGFNSMTPPFLVQEYRDHNESFFKVYVINDEVMAFRRPSLPNLDDLAVLAGNKRNTSRKRSMCCLLKPPYIGLKNVAFDSRYAYPTAYDFKDAPSTIHTANGVHRGIPGSDIKDCAATTATPSPSTASTPNTSSSPLTTATLPPNTATTSPNTAATVAVTAAGPISTVILISSSSSCNNNSSSGRHYGNNTAPICIDNAVLETEIEKEKENRINESANKHIVKMVNQNGNSITSGGQNSGVHDFRSDSVPVLVPGAKVTICKDHKAPTYDKVIGAEITPSGAENRAAIARGLNPVQSPDGILLTTLSPPASSISSSTSFSASSFDCYSDSDSDDSFHQSE